jgi:hypothetical protein
MSLLKAYTLEAAYALVPPDPSHLFHGSIVDSTSGLNLGGGIYYTYQTASPTGLPSFRGHEAGAALSLPFGDRFSLGATVKYFRLRGGSVGFGGEADGNGGITVDAGATIRPGANLSLGVVGYNLRDINSHQAPTGLGYGVSFAPIPELLLVADGLTDFTVNDATRGVRTTLMGGVELVLASKVVFRGGGGRDGLTGNGYFTAGFSTASEIGALDLGARQDAIQGGEGAPRETFFGVSLRLFVPQP